VEKDKRTVGALFTLASVAMGAAGELGSAYACDQILLLLIPVWTVARLRRRVHDTEAALIENAVAEERARNHGGLVRAAVATEVVEGEEIIQRSAAETTAQPPDEDSLKPLAW